MTHWKLLAKYIFDQPDEREKEKTEKWIHKTPGNEKLYNDLTHLKEMKKQEEQINVDRAWNNLKSRIDEDNVTEKDTFSLIPGQLLKYAAIVLILLGIGSVGFLSYEKLFNTQQLISEQNSQLTENKKVTFPDGSIAYLNSSTIVNYPNSFNKSGRLINLRGEAFFEVKHDPSDPFIIKSEKAKIEVLGTSFNVRKNEKGAIEVFVKTGKVKLSKINQKDQSIVVQPGYIGVISNNSIRKIANDNKNYISWLTKELYFKNTYLPKVAKTLEKTYNVTIIIEEELTTENLSLTATFDDESVDYILNVISRTFDIKVKKRKNNKYVLTN
jgi:ferric-dicitrate binding protein FerR (iron transport regulator)